uniref:Uncharacterized protein n=1 Tax=Amphimedon queenslandica TaxID=400682 RepID=A0A1X7T9N5_AMPQE
MPDTIAEFVNNAGVNGGAIALYSSAFIEISRNTSFLFEGNKARNRGGAIYAESFGTSLEKTSLDCLIRYSNATVVPSKWSTTFNFRNNTANLHNNSIYASTIKPCTLLSGYANDINERLMNVFCWNEEEESVWEYNSDTSQNACMSQIQTDIASFNPEKSDGVIELRPGEEAKLEIQPLNDQNSNVSEYIYHVYSQNENVTIHNDYYYVSDDTVFVYPTSNKTVKGMIHVEAVQQNIVQFDLKVVFEDCHPGLTVKPTARHSYLQCTCSPYTKAGIFSCNNETFTAELLQGYWIGNYSNKTMYGQCISCKTRQVLVHITLNQSLDEFERKYCSNHSGGVLCNQCNHSDGYAPAISYDKFKCVKCTHTVDPAGVSIFVICDVLLPLVYLIAVYIFDVPLTSGLFHGPILLCQLVSSIVLLDGGGIIAFNSLYNSSGADKLQRAYTGLTQEDGKTPKKIDPNIIEASSMLLLSLLIALSLYQYAYTLADVPLSKWAFILQGILVWIPLVWIAIVYCRLFYLRNWDTLKEWFSKVYCCCKRRCAVRDRDNEARQPLVSNSDIHQSVNNRSTELMHSHSFKSYGVRDNESVHESNA